MKGENNEIPTKIVSFFRCGTVYVHTVFFKLTGQHMNIYGNDHGGLHTHDKFLKIKIDWPIVYLCRNPLHQLYSIQQGERRRKLEFDLEDWKKRLLEHLDYYINEKNIVIRYEHLSHATHGINDFKKIFRFIDIPFEDKILEKIVLETDKQAVLDYQTKNIPYFSPHLLTEEYRQGRIDFTNDHREEFHDFFKDYEWLFEDIL